MTSPVERAVTLPTLPRVFVATDGRSPLHLPAGLGAGFFLRDLDLATLVEALGPAGWLAAGRRDDGAPAINGARGRAASPVVGLDVDSVVGLNADLAGVRFAIRRLGIKVVLTRRPGVAAQAAELGALGLLHIFAFDSTGLARSLEGHPRLPGVGSAISPGPVLAHIAADDLVRVPRPIAAYGLIGTPELAFSALRIAETVIVGPACAAQLAAGAARAAELAGRGSSPESA